MSDVPKIPLCRSEFLQDFSIHLGTYLKSAKTNHGWNSFSAKLDICEHEGEQLERLTIWVRTYYSTGINLTLWEDKTIWVSVAYFPEHGEKFQIGFYPDFESLTFDRIVEALVETVSISTRLCYDESPEPLLRKIWKYSGEIETEGVI
ncbi:MAG TPA: hypothetical protein VHG71_04885 [Verrucomicrobiae bacterium]|nr:hypothetical protein [Verrucomicrobiae bacterium]